MKPDEAIEMLQAKLTCMELEAWSCIEMGCDRDCDECDYNYKQGTVGEQEESLSIAIEALKEVQQYREIGIVEECREAVEKQKPKKIQVWVQNFYKCPMCQSVLRNTDKYCRECGQAIDWSEEE